jgi:hypothetical protein
LAGEDEDEEGLGRRFGGEGGYRWEQEKKQEQCVSHR